MEQTQTLANRGIKYETRRKKIKLAKKTWGQVNTVDCKTYHYYLTFTKAEAASLRKQISHDT